MDGLTLPRSARLLKSAEFRWVMAKASKIYPPGFVLFGRRLVDSPAKIGLAVSRKVSKKAVERNRIKRLVRESFRRYKPELVGLNIVFVAKPALVNMSNKQISFHLDNSWGRLVEKCEKSLDG